MSNFQPLEVEGRGSMPQLQVDDNLKILRIAGLAGEDDKYVQEFFFNVERFPPCHFTAKLSRKAPQNAVP